MSALRRVSPRNTHEGVSQYTRRRFSCQTLLRRPAERVEVACGTNGSIQLDIHSKSTLHSSDPVILYFPPGPLYENGGSDISAAEYARGLHATVVRVNYRLDKQHRYPTPVHDALFGYDWVLGNLTEASMGGPGKHPTARLGVIGSFIGGGLASMLALTECHQRGHRVAAAALRSPVLDWLLPETLALDEQKKRPTRRSSTAGPLGTTGDRDDAVSSMVKLRSTLFKRPGDWFDPFASPILFFRSPGMDVPKEDPGNVIDDFEELSRLEEQEAIKERLRLAAQAGDGEGSDESSSDSSKPVARKSARRYPKVDSGLVLPAFRITTESSGWHHDQAEEFAHVLRRSVLRTDEDRKSDPELAYRTAEQRILHHVKDDADPRAEVEALRDWFAEYLE